MDSLIKLLILPTVIGLAGGALFAQSPTSTNDLLSSLKSIKNYRNQTLTDKPAVQVMKATPTLIPTSTLTPTPVRVREKAPDTSSPDTSSGEWGVAKQVGEHTYTINVGNDSSMTSAQEVHQALNAYRSSKGIGQLSWDDKLASYAQGRASHFKNIGTVDSHAGFNSYLENENGFEQLGFMRLGENSYFGGALTGTHLIEWVFSQSPGHDANQLDSSWSHVGVGVTDTSVNLIFGGDKM